MKKTSVDISPIKVENLLLDPDNDRFAELYSGSNKEADLIEYLLYTEAAGEVAKNISTVGEYYPDEVLWVIKKRDKFLVKDGNRRCAAVKALQNPKKYDLDLPKLEIKELPALIYTDTKELERRIQEHHTNSLFKEWGAIAKALKVYEMHKTGSSEQMIREIDSNPSRLIKLASFYYAAVEIAGDDLKKLLRSGRGRTGGKTIIFERLFKYGKSCGYKFKNKPSYEIEITDQDIFEKYIKAIVEYLKDNPDTTHKTIDTEGEGFLKKLEMYGFSPNETDAPDTKKGTETPKAESSAPKKRGSIKTKPSFERKKVAPKLKRLVDECYNLDNSNFANAKMALSRVVFESVLKYVVLETKFNKKKLSSYGHFRDAFFNKHGNKLKYTNFTVLKERFVDLITDTGTKNAFKSFDLDNLHQIIHNYNSGATPGDARSTSENLLPLIEFMLQEDVDLFSSLDTKKLK